MKVLKYIVPLALSLFLSSCREKFAEGEISIEFQFESYDIDLNIVDNPYITCIVNSETGLRSVSMYIIGTDGTKTQYKEPVTSFFNQYSHSIHERPIFDENMSGFEVVAEDLGGKARSGTAEFRISPYVAAPSIVFGQESLSFAEGDVFPEFTFDVNANTALQSVSVDIIESGIARAFLDSNPLEDFGENKEFRFNSREYSFVEYDINKIPSALRITVKDVYGKTGISLLPLKYRALPAPVVSLSPISGAINEFAECRVTGTVSSETGIKTLEYYATSEDGYERRVGSQELTDNPTNTAINFTIPANMIHEYVDAVKVVAIDARNKRTEVKTGISVIPVFTEVNTGTELKQLIAKQLADRNFRSIKLQLAAGTYDMGTDAIAVTKRMLIKGASGSDRPVMKFSGDNVFRTDNAEKVSEISLESIDFQYNKSSARFMKSFDATGAAIGTISIRSCSFTGAFTSLYQSSNGGCVIDEILIDNCVFNMTPGDTGSALLQFAKDNDKVKKVKLTKSTIIGFIYMAYFNSKNSTIDMEISHCTFVNTKGKSTGGYFIASAQSSLTGTLKLNNLLFGGSNNMSSFRMLRANKLTVADSDNYCTPDWKTFTDDATNNSVNFLTTLPSTETNAAVFEDAANLKFNITAGTTPAVKRLGDPRWLK